LLPCFLASMDFWNFLPFRFLNWTSIFNHPIMLLMPLWIICMFKRIPG
jgi:hypothetical protein